MKKLILFALVLLPLGCNQDDRVPQKGDYLIFGHYYGECAGESCVDTFMITFSKLFEDSNDHYAGGNGDFDFHELPNEKFLKVKDLLNEIPTELLFQRDKTFGCPDCADGGGMYIQFKKDGIRRVFHIDMAKRDLPSYLSKFVDQVKESIQIIYQ